MSRSLRRWLRPAAIAAGAVALYALFGFFVVPAIARVQIEKQSRQLLQREGRAERVRFNPFTFRTVIEGLTLDDRDGTDLLDIARLTVDFQVSSLFRRAWTFRDVVIDRPSAVVRIAPDGRLAVADLFEAAPGEAPAEARQPLPRVIVGRLAVGGGAVRFADDSRAPAFSETLAPLNLEVHELTTVPDRAGDHAVTVGIGPETKIRWSGRQTIEPFGLTGRFELSGISLVRIWEYAAPAHPLELHQGLADLAFSYEVRRPGKDLTVAVSESSLTVRGLAVRPRAGGEDWLATELVEVRDVKAGWPARAVEIGAVSILRPRGVLYLEPGGGTNWNAVSGAAAPPGATAMQAASPPEATSSPGAAPPAPPWTVKAGAVEIADGAARLEDRTFAAPVRIDLSAIGLRVENVTSDLATPLPLRATARVNTEGELRASGTLVPDPFTMELDVDLAGLDIVPLKPYMARLPGAEIEGGTARGAGKLSIAPGSPWIRFEGECGLDRFQLAGAGAERLIAWDRADIGGLRLTLAPNRLRIRNVVLDGAFAKVFIDREGNINLAQLGPQGAPAPVSASNGAPSPAAGTAGAPAPQPSTADAGMPVDIGAIALRDATVDFTDESLILPFGTKIHSLKGSVRDVSTTSAAAARLDLDGRVGNAGLVKAVGTLRMSDPLAATDVSVTFRDVGMPDLTPYVAHFAGYSVKQGSLDLDLHYRIQDRRLVGDHKVVATDMELGPKVAGAEGPGLPVRLAIALLKDRNGRIDLAVPVEGTIDSPEFAYRKVFWQAVKTILGNLVKAPFRAIGRMFGSDDEDLDLVGFVSGRGELPDPEQETLAKIAAELAARGEISIEVGGRFDPEADVAALRRDRLEARIDARRTGEATLEAILEALYAESFTPVRLEDERARFQPQAAAVAAAPEAGTKARKGKKAAPPPPRPVAPATFDAAGFYDALRAQLLAAEQVGEAELDTLSRARAAAIVAALTAPGGLDPSRVKVADSKPVSRKKRGSDLVASELTMTVPD